MPAIEKIRAIRSKMEGLDPESPMYQAYEGIVKELEGTLPTPKVVVHRAAEPEICESCQ